MAGNSKETSQHAKEAGIFSAFDVRAIYRLRGSLARCVHAHYLRGRHYRADASFIARHRASDCLRRSVDEVCTPSRDYQTRYAVKESRAARRHLPASPLGRSLTIDTPTQAQNRTLRLCAALCLLVVSGGVARASARTSTPDFFAATAQKMTTVRGSHLLHPASQVTKTSDS